MKASALMTTAALIVTVAASSATAFTCKNTVKVINGDIVYTASQCTGQEPAPKSTLELMSFMANNPNWGENKEVVVVPVVAPVAVVTPVAETVVTPVAETVVTPVAETVVTPVAEAVAAPVAEAVEVPVAEAVGLDTDALNKEVAKLKAEYVAAFTAVVSNKIIRKGKEEIFATKMWDTRFNDYKKDASNADKIASQVVSMIDLTTTKDISKELTKLNDRGYEIQVQLHNNK